jgi:DNA-binding NtrC family response regulator
VRELEHVVAGAATMAEGSRIGPADLGLASATVPTEENLFAPYLGLPLSEAKSQLVEALERTLIAAALERTKGNVTEAARQLGIHRQSLQQKMSQWDIRR